ncbi:hypothetical protein [Sphingomonas sp.]|uniref:hypothetical protein n=1 Tax=Sphingomonas sp. TaxID=28214 RepID=UPI0031DB899F
MMASAATSSGRAPVVISRPLWQALQSASTPRSIAELQAECRVDYDAVHAALSRWQKRGAVVRHPGKPLRFALAPDAQTDAPPSGPTEDGQARMRQRTARQRIWTAMRVLKTFDVPTLRMAAEATDRAVETYLNALRRAGYVRIQAPGSTASGRIATYRLHHNTGPHCPTTRRPGGASRVILIDHNSGRTVDISPGVAPLRRKSKVASADGGVG